MRDWEKVSSRWASSSSSLKLLLFVVPLVLVSGFVSVVGPRTSTWVSLSYYPWPWGSGFPSSSSSTTTVMTMTTTSLSTKEGEQQLKIHLTPKVVGLHHVEETLSDTSIFNRSSSVLAKEIFETQQLDEKNVKELQSPIDRSDASPVTMKAADVGPATMEVEEDGKLERSLNGYDVSPVIMKVPEEENKQERLNASAVAEVQKKRRSKLERLEAGLSRARVTIREAAHQKRNQTPDLDYVPQGPMYWNAQAFHRSYLEMEKQFKVFVYEEGEPPLFHNGPCGSIYSSEGNFIHQMEMDKRFRTQHPEEAHVFFLPFSVAMMVRFVYVRDSHDIGPIKHTVTDYVNIIAGKYPYWNRSLAADHFMLSCHDWGPATSTYVPHLYNNGIRVLCNANTSEGFNPAKDASFPEINMVTREIKGLIGGPSPSHRPTLAFFAGKLHGPVRPVLFEHWKNKDEDVQVYESLPRGLSYYDMMRKSKYCICPSGYEVASPRVVEALYVGCVPVLISDHYVPPFSDILNWRSFSVEVPVNEIPNLKRILLNISSKQYIRMQRRGLLVRKHFEVNFPPKRFDVYHMILHSVWLRRLNVRIHDEQI
ncbi:PREDICTED: probable glycosyltransferase At5g03795 [Nelumbo nucifera]|uniref:Probable glycosyltransferase At5g03795 n=1 Tax=Nelumbo nucifera TaxID=4432 RepID=A0A1U7Z9P3_NELNU|nr:PREDICTED: probable glycosyltransferase At5g03795 [Nelumbo nucifera]